MTTATIYKISKYQYLIFGSVKTASGFRIGAEPYIRIKESEVELNDTILVEAIKTSLSHDEIKRVPDPKDWKEHEKEFLRKTGLKSMKELNGSATLCCAVKKENGNIVFTPTKHAEKPDKGFVNKSMDEPVISVALTASDRDIVEAIGLAFTKCE